MLAVFLFFLFLPSMYNFFVFYDVLLAFSWIKFNYQRILFHQFIIFACSAFAERSIWRMLVFFGKHLWTRCPKMVNGNKFYNGRGNICLKFCLVLPNLITPFSLSLCQVQSVKRLLLELRLYIGWSVIHIKYPKNYRISSVSVFIFKYIY